MRRGELDLPTGMPDLGSRSRDRAAPPLDPPWSMSRLVDKSPNNQRVDSPTITRANSAVSPCSSQRP